MSQCDYCGATAFTWKRELGCDIGECAVCGRYVVEVDAEYESDFDDRLPEGGGARDLLQGRVRTLTCDSCGATRDRHIDAGHDFYSRQEERERYQRCQVVLDERTEELELACIERDRAHERLTLADSLLGDAQRAILDEGRRRNEAVAIAALREEELRHHAVRLFVGDKHGSDYSECQLCGAEGEAGVAPEHLPSCTLSHAPDSVAAVEDVLTATRTIRCASCGESYAGPVPAGCAGDGCDECASLRAALRKLDGKEGE